MMESTEKHFHVSANRDLYDQHIQLKKRIAALGMVYPGMVKTTIVMLDQATALVHHDVDVYEKDIANYKDCMGEAIMVANDLASNSDLSTKLTELRYATLIFVTGEIHDPSTDYPSDDEINAATEILLPILKKPHIRIDKDGVELLPVKSVKIRLARALAKIPKEYWPM